MTKKNQPIRTEKDKLYEEIAQHCDKLCIARYLKNEAKSALKYFHVHKLSNIKKNLKEFSEYLIFLNSENCKRIENFNYQLWQISEDSSLQPWEKISAAIGYAKFDTELDKTVNDVFKRADRAMYDRKESMKANRDY